MRHELAHVTLVVAVFAFASPARAVDGVIEINQAKAIAGGVTATDTPGFPVTIDTAGSYRLTGNLTTVGNVDAISITAGAVVLDLNGFAITGDNSCTGNPVTACVFSGSVLAGAGVRIAQTGVTVRNGTAMGNRGPGVIGNPGVSSGVVVEDILARSNGFFGVVTASNFGRVARCRGIGNWGGGIGVTGPGATAIDNESNGNSLAGLQSSGGGGNAIFRNRSLSNGGPAFALDPADLASWNVISDAAIGAISTLDNRCAGGLC